MTSSGHVPPTDALPRRPEPDREPDPDPDADARALASSLRIRVLRMCLDEALTNREIADRLGRNPATVLHHVRTLVDRGFLAAEPVRRGARGSREVPYRATRRSWTTPGTPAVGQALLAAFVEEVGQVSPDRVQASRLGLRLDQAGREELDRRLHEVLQDFAQRAPTPGGEPVSVFLVVHDDPSR